MDILFIKYCNYGLFFRNLLKLCQIQISPQVRRRVQLLRLDLELRSLIIKIRSLLVLVVPF